MAAKNGDKKEDKRMRQMKKTKEEGKRRRHKR